MRGTVPSKKEKEKRKMVMEDHTYDRCILYTCVESLMMKHIILYIYMLNLKMPKDGDVGLCKPKQKNSLNL